MHIIDGRKIADEILSGLKKDINNSSSKVGLAVVLIGDDEASKIYVGLKEKSSKEIGINFRKVLFDKSASEEHILDEIEKLNQDENIHGIIVQLPLPEKFDTDKIISAISPEKDADGFRENSLNENPVFPSAILKMIKSASGGDLENKKAVTIANSEKFGEMMNKILLREGIKSDYVFCSGIGGQDISGYDIVITACGVPHLIKNSMVKNGAIIIDGGIKKEGKTVLGDVDMDSFIKTDCAVSPVPGGVGPVTVACLLESVYLLNKKGE